MRGQNKWWPPTPLQSNFLLPSAFDDLDIILLPRFVSGAINALQYISFVTPGKLSPAGKKIITHFWTYFRFWQ